MTVILSHRGLGTLDISDGLAEGATVSFEQQGVGALRRTMQDKAREVFAVNDFLPTGASNDWRTAIVAAHTELGASGGVLRFPRQLATRDIDNTGLGPFLLSSDGIQWEGDSVSGVVVRNVSTDGTALFQTTTGVKRWAWRRMKIISLATAGHIWSGGYGISFSVWEDLWVQQLATTKSIMVHALNTEGEGFYESEFARGMYEHGTANTPATVPAFDLSSATVSILNLVSWRGPIRFHAHGSYAPFFRVVNDAAGSYLRNINWTGPINIETPRRGIWYLAGLQQCTIEDVGIFDTSFHEGHGVELAEGAGGKECDHVIIKRLTRYGMIDGGTVGAAAEPFVTVATLVQSGGTATCTTSADHGFVTGDSIDFVGASPAAYNGAKSITVTGASTFTFTIGSGTASPATGTIKAARIGRAVTSITHVAGVATVTTPQAHGLAVEQRVNNLGANQAGYNGRFTVLSVPTPTTFTFAVDPGTVTPATGTITTQAAAVDIKVGDTCTNTTLEDIGSASAINEIDAGGTAMHAQASSKSDFYRLGANSVYSEIGAAGQVQARTLQANTGVIVGSGQDSDDKLTKVIKVEIASVTWGSIAAGAIASQDLTVTGVLVQDRVAQGYVSSGSQPFGNAGLIPLPPQVVATDTVRVTIWNTTAGALTPTTRNWHFTVFSHQ